MQHRCASNERMAVGKENTRGAANKRRRVGCMCGAGIAIGGQGLESASAVAIFGAGLHGLRSPTGTGRCALKHHPF